MVKAPILLSIFRESVRYSFLHGWRGFGIFTHLTLKERLILYMMARRLEDPSTLVEIGSYLGASAYFLAAAAGEHGSDVRVFCVDTWKNDGMSEGKRDTWDEFQKNTSRFSRFIVPCRGTSVGVASEFSRSIDLLFIDGDHSFEGCAKDVENWLPLVRRGGTVLFHDYGWVEAVRRITHDLLSQCVLREGVAFGNLFWAYKG